MPFLFFFILQLLAEYLLIIILYCCNRPKLFYQLYINIAIYKL